MPMLVELGATALAAASAAGLAAYGGLSNTSQLFGDTLVAPPRPGMVALTFDDGPNPRMTPRLLELLAKHKVRATFFLIGEYVLREPGLTREIVAAGHTVGNHTMNHPWLPRHSARYIRDEVIGGGAAIEATLGVPVKLFRPPHGARRPAVLRVARELGLETVMWNLIVGDWRPERSAVDLLRRFEDGIRRNEQKRHGTNLVLHDGSQATPAADRERTLAAVDQLLARLPADTEFVVPPRWLPG